MTWGLAGSERRRALAGDAAGRHSARLRRRAMVGAGTGAGTGWLALRIVCGSPAGGQDVPGEQIVSAGLCQVAAWGLLIGMIAAAVARGAGRPQAGWVGAFGAILFGLWQHRLPPWFTPGLADQVLGLPWAGGVRPPPGDWAAVILRWWTAGWTVADLLVALVVGALTWRWLDGAHPARAMPTGRLHVLGALACVAVLVVMVSSLGGLADDTAVSARAAGAFLAANALPLLAATLSGLAGIGCRPDARVAAVASGALGLDTCAGLLGERDIWTGPQHLGLPPGTGTGIPEATSTILALTGITATVCLILLSISPVARLLDSLHHRPGASMLLALIADTIDALATQAGLSTGTVVEANPLVRQTGMAVKWAVVTILLVLLYRLRPRSIWIVAAAYLLVAVYHLMGVLLLA